MTAAQAILALGTIMLTGCGAGLVLIHDSNPLLKGLNWMGAALVAGGAAAALLLFSGVFPPLEPLSNIFILLAFLCCYRADSYLIGAGDRRQRLGMLLLGLQLLGALLQWAHLLDSRAGIVLLSCTTAIQLQTTARLIRRATVTRGRLAAQFTVGLMRFLEVANLLRGVVASAGLLRASARADMLNLVTYTIFVASGIGLAFAFFWRATTKLSLELEHMASTDPLTRVYNRRVFLDWCENEQTRSLRLNTPFSVLMLDFDHFKRINDTYGHLVGDQVLCAAVERIQDSIRGIDVLCRWGGEEFAVLLPNASAEATRIVAERVRRNVPTLKVANAHLSEPRFAQLTLSVSIGSATFDGGDDHHEAMLQRADTALYEAKRSGRNRVVFSGRSTQTGAEVFAGAPLVLEPQ